MHAKLKIGPNCRFSKIWGPKSQEKNGYQNRGLGIIGGPKLQLSQKYNVLLKEVLHHVMLMVEYEFSFLGL